MDKTSLTSQEYADAIAFHAEKAELQTLYPGQVYEDLALFLKRPPLASRKPSRKTKSLEQSSAFATLYTTHESTGRERRSFEEADQCMQALKNGNAQSQAQILFLKGYPSPEWITSIGSEFRIDPEFFNSYLRFRIRRNYFSMPTLPSSSDNIVSLKFVTIGSREPKQGVSNQQIVDRLRSDGTSAMHTYQHDLMLNSSIKRGDSIVRSFSVLDEKHFIIEQQISVCLNQVEKAWLLLICTDAGNDLSEGPSGPWLTRADRTTPSTWTLFYPTIQHRPKIALKSKSSREESSIQTKFPQTLSVLAEDYMKFSDPQLVIQDPFYALNELFRFSAFSELQFLNMIETKVLLDTGYNSLAQEKPTLSNLLYCQELLDRHITYLQQSIDVIERRGGLHWPHVQNKSKLVKADFAANSLLVDFESLLRQAESLSSRCSRGMSVIMNNAALAESKRAIMQAEWVAKLTLIAFFYIPLSFTTSLFGMNFVELGTGTLSIWIWFAVSLPILIITGSFLFFNPAAVFRRAVRRFWT